MTTSADQILNNMDPQELRNILKRLKLKGDASIRAVPSVVINQDPGQFPPSSGDFVPLAGHDPNKILFTDGTGVVVTDEGFEFFDWSFSPGSLIASSSVSVTSSTGTQITGLSIGEWYCIEGASGPWGNGIGNSGYNFEMSLDGSSWSGHIGYDDFNSRFQTTIPSFAAFVEAIDSHYGRVYFKASSASVWMRVADVSFGDNTGTFGYNLKNATVVEKAIYLDDVEYTLAKLGDAIHGATAKAEPVLTDEIPIWDSESGLLKNIQIGDVTRLQERYLAVYNYYLGSGTIAYNLGLAKSSTGRDWQIDTEPVIALGGGGAWDSFNHQFPRLLMVNGVIYLYFSGKDGSAWNHFKIGLAQSFDLGQTWVKHGSNPLINNNVGWENTNVFAPVVLYDREESNASKRWKMWYSGSSFGEGIGYAYSSDGISWTKAGGNPVLSLGTSGQWDDTYIMAQDVIRRGEEFILFYGGKHGDMWQNGYVTFTDPEGTYTRSSFNPILGGDGISTSLTANLTSGTTTATVTDATIFPIGGPVWIYNGNLGASNRFLTHVVKRNSSTSLELADAAPVTVTSGGVVRSIAYNSVFISGVRYDDGYKFTFVPFQTDPSETGTHELTMWAYANDDLEHVYIDYSAGLQVPVTVTESSTNTSTSRENWTVLDLFEEERRHKPAGAAGTITLFDDTEGDPEDVTTGSAADGTSDFAARRDHVHHGSGEILVDDAGNILFDDNNDILYEV